MTDYRLSDLLDMALIQKLADSNYLASGLPMTILDATDHKVLVTAGWTDVCTHFHRANAASLKRCEESNVANNRKIPKGGVKTYKCKNGLWHIAIPIVVTGKLMATMLLSQFYFEGEVLEREYFARQAHEFGFDKKAYLAALDKLPVFSAEKVNYIVAYDKALVQFIEDLAEQSLQIIKTKKSLAESEEKYRSLVNNVNIGVYRNTLKDGRHLHANPALVKILGYDSLEDLLQQDAKDEYRDPNDRWRFIEAVRQNGFVKDMELRLKKKDGTPIWCSCTAVAVLNAAGEPEWVDGVLEDITERKEADEKLQQYKKELEIRVQERTAELMEANARLRELSEKDPLTMIANRRSFFASLENEMKKAKRFKRALSLLMIDVDHFKEINDRYGHNCGDEVLKTTAEIMGSMIRHIDVLARHGGEEFVVLISETELEGASALANRMRVAIEAHSFPDVGRVTISAGVAAYESGDSVTNFIEKADKALYEAKRNGRNRVEKYHAV